ncbi:hypothetical protein CALCODRAFT_484748 [Calocera cornea HHB12733]|uniref:Uncharacterized protein n=1 Tax=Calocera cornea HHB12733 TaxID=1353952 RepID=A0A165ET66_9BASI|nr:hypothetical protein CALCODRAFT_484748 [Calocera cornea HHB12733]
MHQGPCLWCRLDVLTPLPSAQLFSSLPPCLPASRSTARPSPNHHLHTPPLHLPAAHPNPPTPHSGVVTRIILRLRLRLGVSERSAEPSTLRHRHTHRLGTLLLLLLLLLLSLPNNQHNGHNPLRHSHSHSDPHTHPIPLRAHPNPIGPQRTPGPERERRRRRRRVEHRLRLRFRQPLGLGHFDQLRHELLKQQLLFLQLQLQLLFLQLKQLELKLEQLLKPVQHQRHEHEQQQQHLLVRHLYLQQLHNIHHLDHLDLQFELHKQQQQRLVDITLGHSTIPTGATVTGGSSYWQTFTLVTTEINGQSTTIPVPTTLNIGPAEPSHNPMSSPGAIAGAVIGALAGLAILLFIFWRIRRRSHALASLPYTRRRRDMGLEGEMYDDEEEEMTQRAALGPGVGRTTPGPYEYGVVGGLAPPSHEATISSVNSHSPSASTSATSYLAAATPLVPASPFAQQHPISPPPQGAMQSQSLPPTAAAAAAMAAGAYPYPAHPGQAATRREASSSGSIFHEEGVWPPPQSHTPTPSTPSFPPTPLQAYAALGQQPQQPNVNLSLGPARPAMAAAHQGHVRGASGSLGSRGDAYADDAGGEADSLIGPGAGGGDGYGAYTDDPVPPQAEGWRMSEHSGSGSWGQAPGLAALAAAAGSGSGSGSGSMSAKQRERASILAQQAEARQRRMSAHSLANANANANPLSPTSGSGSTTNPASPTSAYPTTIYSAEQGEGDPRSPTATIVQHLDGGRAPPLGRAGQQTGEQTGEQVVELPPRYDQIRADGEGSSRDRVRNLREKAGR